VFNRILFNLIQVLVVMAFAPLVSGVVTRLKEIIQSKRGPSIFQPYRDLWKLFHKDEVISAESSWLFRFTPYLLFVVPIFVTLLIPVLTTYPLFFAFMGDMLGGGFVLSLGGFFAVLAAVDTGNPYGPMGASRTRMVSFLPEPVFMIVFFTVSFVAGSTIPYIVQQHWVTPVANFFEPSHVLLMLAFLMLILAEGGRIPVDNPTGHFELAMIDESKSLEYSGRRFALVKWGGYMKFFVLLCIYHNVLVTPWGLAQSQTLGAVLLAIPLVLLKILCFVIVLVIIESSAAFLLLQVRDYKRLFAYSTVEHMGIIFVAAGFGVGGNYSALLQIIGHSLTKSFCFYAAGLALLVLGTREIAAVRGLIRTSPFAATMLLLGALAIGGAPPFAVFLSEFSIFRAGLEGKDYVTVALLAIFIAVAFFGILLHVNRMVFGSPTPSSTETDRKPLPFTCVLTLFIAAVPVLVLGVYQPQALHVLLDLAAAQLAPLTSS